MKIIKTNMSFSKWVTECIRKSEPPPASNNKSMSESTVTVDNTKNDAPITKPNIFDLFRRNWPQIVKFLPGILFMWTAAMKFSWQTSVLLISSQWTQNVMLTAWFLSVTLGASIAVLFIYQKLKMNIVYTAAAILHITPIFAGLMQKSETSNTGRDYDNLFVLYVDVILPGLIYGLNFVTVLCYAVDYSTREFRGRLVRLICKSSWIFTVLMKLLIPHDDISASNFKYCIYTSIAVLVFIAIHVISEDTFSQVLQSLIKEDKDKEAMELAESEPHKDQETRCYICTKDVIRPIMLVLGSRILAVLVNNISLLFIILWLTLTDESLTETLHTKSDNTFVSHLLMSTKVVAGIGIMLVPDSIGNRRVIRSHRIYYVASLLFAVSLAVSYFIWPLLPLNIFVVLIYATIGVGIDAISLQHLTEAFALRRRSGLIALVLIIETFFDTCLTALFTKYSNNTLQLPMAVGIAVISISLLIRLPNKRDEKKAVT